MGSIFLRWSDGNAVSVPFECTELDQVIEKLSEFRLMEQASVAQLHVCVPTGRSGQWGLPHHNLHVVNDNRPSDTIPDTEPQCKTLRSGLLSEPVLRIGSDSASEMLEWVMDRCRQTVHFWGTSQNLDVDALRSYALRDDLSALCDDLRRNISMRLDEDLLPDDPEDLFPFAVEARMERDFHRAYPRQ